MIAEWHTQDWLLIIESLTEHAGPNIENARERRAWELAEEIVTREDVALEQVPRQIDREWSGPEVDS